jgi:hypothetical protein
MEALPPSLSKLQREAQNLGLWNLFLPPRLIPHLPASAKSLAPSTTLTYREYGILAESMGRSELGAMACNCSAPDTGNMEVLLEFGTPQQKETYLIPLLQGRIRSTFLMTEPQVASSDPTNLETKLIKKSNNEYILSGRKWWSSGAMDPRCRMALVVAKIEDTTSTSDTNKHNQHTIVLVPLPHPKVRAVRPLTVFGYDDAPFGHADLVLDNVPLNREQLVGGEGSGFKVSQARLGPGRIHHCMRAIGMSRSTVALICIFPKTNPCSFYVLLLLFLLCILQLNAAMNSCCKDPWNEKLLANTYGNTGVSRVILRTRLESCRQLGCSPCTVPMKWTNMDRDRLDSTFLPSRCKCHNFARLSLIEHCKSLVVLGYRKILSSPRH